jgi:hypothetical protein
MSESDLFDDDAAVEPVEDSDDDDLELEDEPEAEDADDADPWAKTSSGDDEV